MPNDQLYPQLSQRWVRHGKLDEVRASVMNCASLYPARKKRRGTMPDIGMCVWDNASIHIHLFGQFLGLKTLPECCPTYQQ